MTKRFVPALSVFSIVALAVLVIGMTVPVIGMMSPGEVQPAQRGGNDEPLAPCGPAGDLSDEFSNNVAADSRCFELRLYTVDQSRVGVGNFEGGIDELHQRFREKEVELFEKHGAEIVGVWQHLENPDTLVWMLAYRDRAHREEVWAGFGADPEWTELRNKYFVPLTNDTFLMSASDYSALK